MDKFLRPSLTDLTRHAFKAEAKKIAEGVRDLEGTNYEIDKKTSKNEEEKKVKSEEEDGREGRGRYRSGQSITSQDGVEIAQEGREGSEEERERDRTFPQENLTLPPRVRIVKEWGEREK